METARTTALKKEILGEIRRETNGAVVGAMSERIGGEPFFSYGVSAVAIKSIAKRYYPDHELAAALFDTQIRELKLAAVYIEDPEAVSPEQMERWAADFVSLELSEHCANMLFFKSEQLFDVAEKWIESAHPFTVKAGFSAVGKRVKTLFRPEEKPRYEPFIEKAFALLAHSDNPHTTTGAVFLLTATAAADPEFRERILRQTKAQLPADLQEDVLWQISD